MYSKRFLIDMQILSHIRIDMLHICGMISRSTDYLRTKPRCIGLQEQRIQGDVTQGISEILGILIGDIAAESDIEL